MVAFLLVSGLCFGVPCSRGPGLLICGLLFFMASANFSHKPYQDAYRSESCHVIQLSAGFFSLEIFREEN